MAAEQFRQLADGDALTTPTLGSPDAWQSLRAQQDSDLTQPILSPDSQTTHPILSQDSQTTYPILSPDSQTTQPIQGLTGDQPITPPPPMPESGAPVTPPPPPEPPTPEPPAEPTVPDPAGGTTPDPAEKTKPDEDATPDPADGTEPAEPAEGKPAEGKPGEPAEGKPADPNAPATTMGEPEAKPKLGGWEVDPERLRGFSDAVVRARSYLDAVQMKVDRMQGAELTPQLGTSPVGQQLAKKFDDRLNSTDGLREMLVEAMKRMEKFVTSAEKAAKTYEEIEQNNVDTFDNYYGVEIEMADKPAAG